MKALLLYEVACLMAIGVVGCNLNLDESLINEGTAPIEDGGTDAHAADGDAFSEPKADGDANFDADAVVDVSQDPVGDPATEPETGQQDVKSDPSDTGTDSDAGGCAAGPDAGACVTCVLQKCCATVTTCEADPTCHTAYGAYATCVSKPATDGGTDGGTTCSSLLGWGAGQSAIALATCISKSCPICPL